jgi:hypothetical protein
MLEIKGCIIDVVAKGEEKDSPRGAGTFEDRPVFLPSKTPPFVNVPGMIRLTFDFLV